MLRLRDQQLVRPFLYSSLSSLTSRHSKFNPLYTVVINVVFWSVSLPPAFISLSKIGSEGELGLRGNDSGELSSGQATPAEKVVLPVA